MKTLHPSPRTLFLLSLLLCPGGIPAQEAGAGAPEAVPEAAVDEEAIHDALRALKGKAEETFNHLGATGDAEALDALLELVHTNIVLMPMNGSRLIGREGILQEFERTMTGPDRTVASMHHTFDVAALSVLHGDDTAVAHGTTHGSYRLSSGLTLDVDANWTATMVEEDGRWLLASFQFAPSIFDNPLLDKARSLTLWVALAALVLGLSVGLLATRLLGPRREVA